MKSIKQIFLTGIIVILPAGITFTILVWLFNFFDSFLGDYLSKIFKIYIPGAGILATVILVFLIGLLVRNVVGKKIHNLVETLFSKIPFVKTIYSPIKDILKNFTPGKTQSFSKAVMVDFPRQGIKSIGFLTNDSIKLNGNIKTAIFIPTTPNPTNGFLIFVDRTEYEELDIGIDEAIKLIITMGSAKN